MQHAYEHVRQADEQLRLAPLRWLTRVMSSWWTVGALALAVGGYLLAAYVPIGSGYIWQQRWIDAAQTQVLRWLPLHLAMLLLGCAAVWAALRRLVWRVHRIGLLVAMLGVAVALLGLSLSLRFGAAGVVTLTPSTEEGLALTTVYADPVDRVLIVQFGPNPPTAVPLPGLPRWNDAPPSAEGQARPLDLAVHTNPVLGRQLDYGARLTVVGYLAEAEVKPSADGAAVRVSPVPADERDRMAGLPWPRRSALALQIDSEDEAGRPSSLLVWLAFESAGSDRLMPTQRYEVPGLGSVGLAFGPVGRELPFAIAATPAQPAKVGGEVTVHIAETNPSTQRLMPIVERDLKPGQQWAFDPIQRRPGLAQVDLRPLAYQPGGPVLIRLSSRPGRLITFVGLGVAVAGGLLWGLGWGASRGKRAG